MSNAQCVLPCATSSPKVTMCASPSILSAQPARQIGAGAGSSVAVPGNSLINPIWAGSDKPQYHKLDSTDSDMLDYQSSLQHLRSLIRTAITYGTIFCKTTCCLS